MSRGNLKTSYEGNQPEFGRPLALELLEFTTGLNPQSDIGENKRLCDISLQFAALNRARNRPAKEISFPVQWPSDAIYVLLRENGALVIENRVTETTAVVTNGDVRTEDFSKLWIQFNYSDTNAVIRHVELPNVRDYCVFYFSDPSKRLRLKRKASCAEAFAGAAFDVPSAGGPRRPPAAAASGAGGPAQVSGGDQSYGARAPLPLADGDFKELEDKNEGNTNAAAVQLGPPQAKTMVAGPVPDGDGAPVDRADGAASDLAVGSQPMVPNAERLVLGQVEPSGAEADFEPMPPPEA